MNRLDPYAARLGFALVLGGTVLALIAWLVVSSVPFVALGISAVLVGVVALALSSSLPDISPEASSVMLQAGLENLSMLVEEIGLSSAAFYLPSRLAGGVPLALIPLHENSSGPRIQKGLPARLIVSYGPDPGDIGLLVRTAGTTVMRLVEVPPGSSPVEFESALRATLVGRLDLANSVIVYRERSRVVVEIAEPRLRQRDLWICRSLGSPLASIVATLVAEGLDRPVRVDSEHWSARQVRIALEPVDAAI